MLDTVILLLKEYFENVSLLKLKKKADDGKEKNR